MSLRFTLRQLEYFVAVGLEGSILHASQKINVSSPSISVAIAQLETELGIKLFARKHAHNLSLTQAGRQFMVQARRVLQEAEAVNRLANTISGSVQGPLNVGCLLTFAQLVLPRLRRQFEEEYPLVKICQSELDQIAIFDQLRCAQIDIALTYDLSIPKDITFIPIAELPPYAMLSETHPLAHLSVVSAVELQKHPMVLLDLPYSSDYFMSYFKRVGASPKVVEKTRDMAVLQSLVANGFGYSIVNTRTRNDAAPDGSPLKFIPLAEPIRPMLLGVALIKEMANVLVVKAFTEHCEKNVTNSGLLGDP